MKNTKRKLLGGFKLVNHYITFHPRYFRESDWQFNKKLNAFSNSEIFRKVKKNEDFQ